jgi:hypothetical protein
VTNEEIARTLAETLDPRFTGLRGEHEWMDKGDPRKSLLYVCRRCKATAVTSEEWRHRNAHACLRTDTDAWLEVMADCGLTISGMGRREVSDGTRGWIVVLRPDDVSAYWWEAAAMNRQDAIAQAIWEWWVAQREEHADGLVGTDG